MDACRCVNTVDEPSISKVLAKLLDDSLDALIDGVALSWADLIDCVQFPADLMAEVLSASSLSLALLLSPLYASATESSNRSIHNCCALADGCAVVAGCAIDGFGSTVASLAWCRARDLRGGPVVTCI